GNEKRIPVTARQDDFIRPVTCHAPLSAAQQYPAASLNHDGMRFKPTIFRACSTVTVFERLFLITEYRRALRLAKPIGVHIDIEIVPRDGNVDEVGRDSLSLKAKVGKLDARSSDDNRVKCLQCGFR